MGLNMNKKKIKEITETLYAINAFISATYVTKIRKIDHKGICDINESLGMVIKDLRAELK